MTTPQPLKARRANDGRPPGTLQADAIAPSTLYGCISPRTRTMRASCLVMNTASELGQSEPEIAQDVAESIGVSRKVLQAAVERAQREGDIAPERDARILASYLVSGMGGMKTLAKAGADAKTLKDVITVVLSALA